MSSLFSPPHSARKQAASKPTPKLGREGSNQIQQCLRKGLCICPWDCIQLPGERQEHVTSELEWLSAGHRIILIHLTSFTKQAMLCAPLVIHRTPDPLSSSIQHIKPVTFPLPEAKFLPSLTFFQILM